MHVQIWTERRRTSRHGATRRNYARFRSRANRYLRCRIEAQRSSFELMQARPGQSGFFQADPSIRKSSACSHGLAANGAIRRQSISLEFRQPLAIRDKRAIRLAARRRKRRAFYDGRAGDEWLGALAHLGTDGQTSRFLETAPGCSSSLANAGETDRGPQGSKHYYVPELVSSPSTWLIASLHSAGWRHDPHTSPMGFLNRSAAGGHEKPLVAAGVGASCLKTPGFPAISAGENECSFLETAP